ncbi:hypothetical protein [Phyllobacterium leguminum]|uniref:hypothetical protein n=1 Tax=Phyllobacterium leguminum TaxID=314237 RepID=UPI0011B444D1|nr:hypothetical protein [Phyllobacterium leguminum]
MINELAKHIPGSEAVREWVRPQHELCPTDGTIAAVRNDYLKSSAMKTAKSVVFIDRFIYSTLPYDIARTQRFITPTIYEYQHRTLFTEEIECPTHLIIIPSDVATSRRESRKRGWPAEGNPWFDESFLAIYERYYEDLLRPELTWFGERKEIKKLRLASSDIKSRVDEVCKFLNLSEKVAAKRAVN